MVRKQINLNADLGESFGRFVIGDDAALLDVVATANVACGMHGGDPTVMRDTLRAAAARGVSVGAHPGFNDLWGFGRRELRMDAGDLEALVAYQIGALRGLEPYAPGLRVSHVKAHGALNTMAANDRVYADAIVAAIAAVDPTLIHLVMPGTELAAATQAAGLPIAYEAFPDRAYDADGRLSHRSRPGALIKDPAIAAERAVTMALAGRVTALDGAEVALEVQSLCVHGDGPTALAIAKAVRAALEASDVEIVPLPVVVG